MTDVWAESKQQGGSLLVLLAIADFADESGVAYPSVETLANKSRLSERQTQYVLKSLQDQGELEVMKNAGPRGCNLFRVLKLHPRSLQHRGGAVCDIKGVQPTAPEPSVEPSIEPPVRENTSSSIKSKSADFDEFWKAYPRHIAKAAALKAFNKAKLPDIVSLIAALEQQKKQPSWTRDKGQFIPHPATWINQCRWEDEVQVSGKQPVKAGVAW